MRLECVNRCVGIIRRDAAWSPGPRGVVTETIPKLLVFKDEIIKKILMGVCGTKSYRNFY